MCGKEIIISQNTLDKWGKKYCSVKCMSLDYRKVERPLKEKLDDEIQNSNYRAVGKKYGVTGNTIKKWAIEYGIYKPVLKRKKKVVS